MKKIKYILRGAVVLLIVAVMVFSSVAVANTKLKTQLEPYAIDKGTGVGAKGNVVWDNGMHYEGLVPSQWDVTYPFDAIAADDFHFEETTVVTDVHWIGGYYNPAEDGDFDWNISFYTDRGDGNAPGAKIYEQVFPNAEVHETFIGELPSGNLIFSYWVDLADPIPFTGGEKYWISIQGIGIFPPQSGNAGHKLPIVLHQVVYKSNYFGHPDWIDIEEVYGIPGDGCFQLTGDGEAVVADLDCDGEIRWEDVPPGTLVNSTFTVINSGDVGSMLEWNATFPEWGTNWTLNWTFYEYGGFVGTSTPEEVYVEVIAPDKKAKTFEGEILLVNKDNAEDTCSISVTCINPRSREVTATPLQRIFEQFPNLLPILRQLLGLM